MDSLLFATTANTLDGTNLVQEDSLVSSASRHAHTLSLSLSLSYCSYKAHQYTLCLPSDPVLNFTSN